MDLRACAPAHLLVEEITSPAQLADLEPEWRALFARVADASPFQSPEWLLCWLGSFQPERLWTLATRREGRLVGLLPMFVFASGAGARQLTLLGNGVSDRLDLLAEPEHRSAVAASLFAHIDARRNVWTEIDWRDLPLGSPLLQTPFPAAREEVEAEEPCPALELHGGGAAVLAGLRKARRGDLRRCARRLGELGPVRLVAADAAGRSEALGVLIALHSRRWTQRGEEGVFADAAVRAFHEAASARLQRAGMLRLHLLYAGDRAVAAHYGLRRLQSFMSYIHAFDPDLAEAGPGWVLMSRVIEAAAEEGAEVFDFLRGREDYKYEWGATDQPQVRRRIWA